MLIKMNLYNMWSLCLFLMSVMFLGLSLMLNILDMSMLLEWNLIDLNSVSLVYIVYMDWISCIFCFVVLFISSMVVIYSKIYMGEYNYSSIRFLFLVLMFVLSMLLMVLSPNLVSILLGWDGLGLISYCLVIYYSSMSSYLAGMITCLVNRLGDIGLLISISWMLSYGSWNFMFYLFYFSENLFYLLILSSFTKSAQIPFSMWLPAAMAAPTPVSSLVHSSTLVTAGVYLLIRFFNYLVFVNWFLVFVGVLTMIMSSICASYEYDLKSIIALSTLSQLGLMMSCLFMGMVDFCFFHLLSHAMFKSLLFLCSGIMIHLMVGSQDIRCMGSICFSMPITCSCFNISIMALCGFPFLSGFYSKDLIVESSSYSGCNMIFMLLFYLSLGLSSIYSIRLLYYSGFSSFKGLPYLNLKENISLMKYSVVILSLLSLTFGCMYMWLVNLDMKFMVFPLYLKTLTFFMMLIGMYLGYELMNINLNIPMDFYYLNGSMWFMYSYSNLVFELSYKNSINLSYEMNWGEFYGGLGLSFYTLKISNFIQGYSFGSVKGFFLSMIIWLLFLV
uniref:NADH dehydrogenase subunit 5 n=1 Tax=Zahniserius cylindricus TaxID=1671255 RepID=UPI0024358189|nr:NADH dehydrogenase subunit 5 [Zahniserius cylindricus]WEU77802.1 NADH dehydrogenase subunit 5 [Zahniserius cylindricus]